MLTPTTAVLLGAVALVLFGPKQLPELAKSLGKAMGEFKKGLNGDPDPSPASPPQPVAAPPVAEAVEAAVPAPASAAAPTGQEGSPTA